MLYKAVRSLKLWAGLSVILGASIFASGSVLAANSVFTNSKPGTAIVKEDNVKSLKIAKGQYMLPGRCWNDCSCCCDKVKLHGNYYYYKA